MEPKVVLDHMAYRRICHWVDKSDHEVSGLGMVVPQDNGILRISEVFLLPQENTSVHTEIDAAAVAKLLYTTRNSPGELKFWWHSHVNMGVEPSSQDKETWKELGSAGWCVASIFNKRREVRSTFYSATGIATLWGAYPLIQDHLKTEVDAASDPITRGWDREYAENVKERRYNPHFQPYEWVRRDNGTWDRVPKVSSGVGGSPSVPPLELALLKKKPENITKRAWKALKREAAKKPPGLQTSIKPILGLADMTDAYGFDQDERAAFAESGWCENDFDKLHQADVTGHEMLELLLMEVKPAETLQMLSEGWTIRGILYHIGQLRSKQTASDDSPYLASEIAP